MKHVFIVNKFSANKHIHIILENIKIACNEMNIDYFIEYVTDDIHVENILENYQDTEDIIIAVRGRWNS